MTEQECSDSKRKQAQGIQLAKGPQERLVYHHVISRLKKGITISQIAKAVRIT